VSALPHYEALVWEATRVGWPVRFKTDLTEHDRAFLEKRDPSLPFAWMLSEGATYLVGAEWIDRWLRRAHHYVSWVEEIGDETRYYFWNGTSLEEFSAEALRDRLKEHASARQAG
jgi:hypothetical protein